MPGTLFDCPGTRNNIDKITIVNNKINEINARSGNVGVERIFDKLIETPTNISPVKAAAAPAVATKKSFHSLNLINSSCLKSECLIALAFSFLIF